MRSRMHPIGLGLAVGAALCSVWALSRAQSMNSIPKYLLTDKKLVLMGAPQVVAGPTVLDAKWSPDGVHVAAVRHTERSVLEQKIDEIRLVIWSAGRQSHEIWHKEMSITTSPQVAWITSNIVTITLGWNDTVQTTDPSGKISQAQVPRRGVLWVNVAHDDVKMLPLNAGDHLYVSPSQPYAALWSPGQLQVFVLKPDGTTLKKTPIPDNAVWMGNGDGADWSEDGLNVWMWGAVRATEDKEQDPPQTYALNVQTGELRPATKPGPGGNKIPVSALKVTRSFQSTKLGNSVQYLHPLWLESTTGGERPEALIAADSTAATLGPTGEAVLYLSGQTAFVTPLRIGPKEPFLTNLKATLGSNAKQLGLAMVMYAQDYDETFPSPSDSIPSAFSPYLQNDALYDGFNYTYTGGPIGNIPNPAQTQLGTVDGPGGQWIIYVDGHAKWQPR